MAKKLIKSVINKVVAPVRSFQQAYSQAWKKWEASPRHKAGVKKVKEQQYGAFSK